MKKHLYKSIFALGFLATLSSCDLDEYNPIETTDTDIYSKYEGLKGLQAQCYSPIYGQLYTVFDFQSMSECGTDIWWCANNRTNTEQMFYYEGLTATQGKGWDKAFTQMYSALGNCNTVISRASSVTDGNEDDLKTLVAEAFFLRAYYHLLLTTYYGPITLVLEDPVQNVNLTPKRNTLSEIYKSITDDLTYAVKNLPLTPLENNRARATRKAAKGMLCRAYIQGAGQGLSDENGVSYWQLARDEADDFITNATSYGAYLYDDISDMWADTNNRNNKETLFTAAGVDAGDNSNLYDYANSYVNKLFSYSYWNFENLSDLAPFMDDAMQNYLYGRTNNNLLAPSHYLLHCFNPTWDKRWENSFQTAFFGFSMQQTGSKPYSSSQVTVTNKQIRNKYGFASGMKNNKIYPYVDLNEISCTAGGTQYPAKVWPKGDYSGNVNNLQEVKKIYVVDYPLAADDNRFFLYLYPNWADEYKDGYDRTERAYVSVAIDDLMTEDNTRYVSNSNELSSNVSYISNTAYVYQVWPSLNKFIWNYEGVYNSTSSSKMQIRNGDVFIMRMAEVYLIAAEAEQHLGHGDKAAEYLNVLRKRAARTNTPESAYKLSTATEDDIFDEYARELCGEFSRWALLQRHQAFESRLAKYNKRAYASYKPYCIWRPISLTFLEKTDNKEEYGDNGYGVTAKSGLDGFLQ